MNGKRILLRLLAPASPIVLATETRFLAVLGAIEPQLPKSSNAGRSGVDPPVDEVEMMARLRAEERRGV